MNADILEERLGTSPSGHDVLDVCSSIMRLFSLSQDEFCNQWLAYTMSSAEEGIIAMNTDTLQSFQVYLQRSLDKENKRKFGTTNLGTPGSASSVGIGSGGSSVKRKRQLIGNAGIMNMMTPVRPNKTASNTNYSSTTPSKPGLKNENGSSPLERRSAETNGTTPTRKAHGADSLITPSSSSPIKERPSDPSGSIILTLNEHLPCLEDVSTSAAATNDSVKPIKLQVHVSLKKFQYRSMYQKLSEVAEVLDHQIEKMIEVVKEHYNLTDDDIDNPSLTNPQPIVAVGRICCEEPTDDKLNASSVVLETNRKIGSGARVRLNIKNLSSYVFYNGQIVALRGKNSTGSFFTVSEILELPLLPFVASDSLSPLGEKPRKVVVASGPYTSSSDLKFEPLHNLVDHINQTLPDAVILNGPFIDSTHKMIQEGDFDLGPRFEDGGATLDDLFRVKISRKLDEINPRTVVLVIPNIRDAASNHAAYPQPAFDKVALQLPRHVRCLPNPSVFSLDDTVFCASSVDTTRDMLQHMLVKDNLADGKPVDRFQFAFQQILSQRQLYPIFPPSVGSNDEGGISSITGHSLDVPYWSLSEISQTTPDVLICPSRSKPSAYITSNVVTLNPGFMSTGKSGTFATLSIAPKVKSEEAAQSQFHKTWERARVDVQKI